MTHRAVFLCLYLFIQLVSVLVSNKTPIWVRFSFPPHLYAPYNLFFNKTVLAPQSASRCPFTAWQMVFLHSCNQHHRSFSLLFWEMMLAPCSRSGTDLKWQSVSAPLPRGQKSLFMRSDGGRSALINTHIWRKKKKVSRVTVVVLSSDPLQFQMADLIPWIRLGVQRPTEP